MGKIFHGHLLGKKKLLAENYKELFLIMDFGYIILQYLLIRFLYPCYHTQKLVISKE